jgi:hypothetical protein
MRRIFATTLTAVTLGLGGCHPQNDPATTTPSAAASAAPAPPSPPLAPQAQFAVVDLVDLQQRAVRVFAYCKSTQELFVAFDRPATDVAAAGDVLYQWSTSEPRLVHTYALEKGFIVDHLFPSPDGGRLVVALFQTAEEHDVHWEKLALLDTVKHESLSPDLGLYNDRFARVEFGKSGQRIRLTGAPGVDAPRPQLVYNAEGRPATADSAEFPAETKGKLRVIESAKNTMSTHGLYYTDEGGKEYLVTQGHWNDNYDLTRDGLHVVTTTWDGEILAWSTVEKKVVFTEKIAEQYGYLAYDDRNDRFLIGDAMYNGTTHLRALVRVKP